MSTKPCASVKIQTIIHKYAKFLMYTASKSAYNQNSFEFNPYLNQSISINRLQTRDSSKTSFEATNINLNNQHHQHKDT